MTLSQNCMASIAYQSGCSPPESFEAMTIPANLQPTGEAFTAGREGRPEALPRLVALATNHDAAPLTRAYALGYLRVMFAVTELDELLVRLGKHGAQLVGDVVNYEDVYRLCYIRGPEGLLIGLAEELR